MTLKEFIITRLQLFFFLTTMILIASAVLGGIIAPYMQFRYYDLYSPLIIAALCILPTCVTFFKKEPTLLQYILRLALELLLIEVIVLSLVKPPNDFSGDKLFFYVILSVSVFVIYVLAELVMWFKKYLESQRLTVELKKLQAEQE